MNTTSTANLVPVEDVRVGMVDSCGNRIIAVRSTAKSVITTTISRVDGKPFNERHAKGCQMFISEGLA